ASEPRRPYNDLAPYTSPEGTSDGQEETEAGRREAAPAPAGEAARRAAARPTGAGSVDAGHLAVASGRPRGHAAGAGAGPDVPGVRRAVAPAPDRAGPRGAGPLPRLRRRLRPAGRAHPRAEAGPRAVPAGGRGRRARARPEGVRAGRRALLGRPGDPAV